MPDFSATPLLEIIAYVRERLAAGDSEIAFRAADPDASPGRYSGEAGTNGDLHRPFRVWVDLAERLRMRLATPRPAPGSRVGLRLVRLADVDWRTNAGETGPDPTEKYGRDSGYGRIHKLEEPGFVLDFADALSRAELPNDARVLDLGVNTADSLALLSALRPASSRTRFTGIDHCASALESARERFPEAHFIRAELEALPQLALPTFDLVLSIGTLQSPGIDDRAVLRHVVQSRLAPGGAVILGVPNCSYQGGEVLYGAKMKNFTQPDLSLLVKNVAYYRKYLQQHRRRVFVTGKHYVFVTGV